MKILLNPGRTLAYVPIQKNGSKTYTTSFLDAGWIDNGITVQELEHSNIKPFAHIQDPLIRHTKGTVEWITGQGNEWMLDDERLHSLLSTALFDVHTVPISFTMPEWLLKKVHWIPMSDKLVNISCKNPPMKSRLGHPISTTELTLDFLKLYKETNVKISDVSEHMKNRASLRDRLNKIKEKYETHSLQYLYGVDLKIWYDCIPYRDSAGNVFHFKEFLDNGFNKC